VGRFRPWWLAAAAAVIVAFVVLPPLIDTSAPHVPRLTIENNSAYNFTVYATGAKGDGWTVLGTAPAHASTDFDEVYDEGSTWGLEFAAQGYHSSELSVSHHDLASNAWRLVIPDSVGEAFVDAGASPSAS
jgi:hypothetical protein